MLFASKIVVIQVEGGQNKVDSPLSVLEHGILESELGKKKKKKKKRKYSPLLPACFPFLSGKKKKK